MTTPFKRAYKACEACRKNKAKCEVELSATACMRCLREHRECVFPAERSTKRAKLADVSDPDRSGRAFPISQTGPATSSNVNQEQNSSDFTLPNKIDQTATWDSASGHELPQGHRLRSSQSINLVAAETTESDALHSREHGPRQNLSPSSGRDGQSSVTLQSDVLKMFVASSSDAIGLLFRAAEHNDSDSSDEHAQTRDGVSGSVYSMPSPAFASNETLSLWEQFRFVRQGWFTPREAISYIEFFFQNLSSLSPVADSYYADHKNHRRLILEEPLLCCTLIMISARHHVPTRSGGGGRARSDYVHNRMWRHIEHVIQRITFGSEKYSLAKTRTIGSIQALLLIIEWHPQTLHFPPEYDGWDASLAPSVDDCFQQQTSKSEAGKRWREDVFEPAKRSDRMSWMLVGLATTLAHELGVFNDSEAEDPIKTPKTDVQAELRVRRLLYIYTSQLSMRLGCSNIFPNGIHQDLMDTTNHVLPDQASSDREILVTKWIEITKLMTTAAEMLFKSQRATRQMFKTLRYIDLLEHFAPLLRRWIADFTTMSLSTVSQSAKDILLVEYHFVHMYINSAALQALVERATGNHNSEFWLDQDLLRLEATHDFRYVEEVREASVKILHIATKLAQEGIMQYCPVRFFLRVVAASIYLLKTISLGSREADVSRSLAQLQLCIEALQNNRVDDVHLSSRYATLIARHVRHFKRNFRVKKAPASASHTLRQVSGVVAPGSGTMHTNVEITRSNAEANNNATDHSRQRTSEAPFFAPADVVTSFDLEEPSTVEDWLAQPFSTQFAPFGTDGIIPASGLAIDSLDFLWNMTS